MKLFFISWLPALLVFISLFVNSKGLANFPTNTVTQSSNEISKAMTSPSSLDRLKKRIPFYKNTKFIRRENSPDGIFSFVLSNDGWLRKVDINTLNIAAEVRLGINTKGIAISNDGKYVIVGNTNPQHLVILNAKDLSIIKSIDTVDGKGVSSSVSRIYNAPPRYSFIVTLKGIKEFWEIPYSDKGGVEVFKGWAHDYRKDGGEGKLENWKAEESFPIRRIRTETPLCEPFFDSDFIQLIAASHDNESVRVINLDVKKQVAKINTEGIPTFSMGVSWDYRGNAVFAYSNINAGSISVIDLDNGNVIKKIKTAGKSHAIAHHINSPYIWLKTIDDLNNEIIQIINKDTLTVIKNLKFVSGTQSIVIEFIQFGEYVLLSTKSNKDKIIIYNAKTLEKVNVK